MLGVIGGSGLYHLEGINIIKEHDVYTPFGKPSAPVLEGLYAGKTVLFLPRHGRHHQFLPHEVNYRANIFALKQLGAKRLFSVSASGSLREDIKPGELSLVTQYFDHTRGKRNYSFFGDGMVAHVSTANPTCPALGSDIIAAATSNGLPLHIDKAYACVEGPRLGTQAESFFLRDSAKCDLVGMTNVPEAFLAREAQMAYCTVCVVTDFDCWMEDPSQHVTVEKFLETYGAGVEKAKKLLSFLLMRDFSETPVDVREALKFSVMTSEENISAEQREWLSVLRE